MAFSKLKNEPQRTPPSTLEEHKDRERGQARAKISFFLGVLRALRVKKKRQT
jgi:hypothetical protein